MAQREYFVKLTRGEIALLTCLAEARGREIRRKMYDSIVRKMDAKLNWIDLGKKRQPSKEGKTNE